MRIETECRLVGGDKVFIDKYSVGFLPHQGQNATCVDSASSSAITLQLNDGDVVTGSSKGLILTGYYTGAAPDGSVEAEFDLPE